MNRLQYLMQERQNVASEVAYIDRQVEQLRAQELNLKRSDKLAREKLDNLCAEIAEIQACDDC